MSGVLQSFMIGTFVFAIDAAILFGLVFSVLGQNSQSGEAAGEGFVSLMLVLLAVGKTFFLLTSLYVCFRLAKVSPLPFVMGASLSLVVFACCMYLIQHKGKLSAKN